MTPLKCSESKKNFSMLEHDTESTAHIEADDTLKADKVLLRPVTGLPTNAELVGVLEYVFFHIIYRQRFA